MGALTGIVAGVATLGAAVAIYRFAERKASAVRDAVEEIRRNVGAGGPEGAVLDYQKDPEDGVYRAKP
ncbi:MAG: hypothetical protein EVA70_07035 [Parvularculaceae bacterium]|nr:MAG: hypothetical protein EVA70_07035 [Parvularculaceae bacterium]